MSRSFVQSATWPAEEPHQSTVADALRDTFWEISYSLANLLLGRRSHRKQ